MEKLPENLGTKNDILLFIEKAKKGEYDKAELKRRLQGMQAASKHWVFSKEVTATYTPDVNEKVMEEQDGEAVKYVCYSLQDNMSAPFLQAGIEEVEMQGLINQL